MHACACLVLLVLLQAYDGNLPCRAVPRAGTVTRFPGDTRYLLRTVVCSRLCFFILLGMEKSGSHGAGLPKKGRCLVD